MGNDEVPEPVLFAVFLVAFIIAATVLGIFIVTFQPDSNYEYEILEVIDIDIAGGYYTTDFYVRFNKSEVAPDIFYEVDNQIPIGSVVNVTWRYFRSWGVHELVII